MKCVNAKKKNKAEKEDRKYWGPTPGWQLMA